MCNVVTGEETLGKKQVLPLLQTTILGQQHITQHCLRQHFCKPSTSSPWVSPQYAYMVNTQLCDSHITNLASDQYGEVQNLLPFQETKKQSCAMNPDYINLCLSKKRQKLPLRCHLNHQRNQHLNSDMIRWGLTQHC